MQGRIEILYVEDTRDNVLILEQVFKTTKICNELHVVSDGSEAIEFLKRKGDYKRCSHTGSHSSGLEFAENEWSRCPLIIKSDPDLKIVPVIVFSDSQDNKDIVEAYGLHANSFMTKPVDFEKFSRAIRSMEEFWFEAVKLPPKKQAG